MVELKFLLTDAQALSMHTLGATAFGNENVIMVLAETPQIQRTVKVSDIFNTSGDMLTHLTTRFNAVKKK